jgi:hypothetical protein
MLDRLFGSKKKRPQDNSHAAVAYRGQQRIVQVQIPFFEKRAAELRRRIAEKQTNVDEK